MDYDRYIETNRINQDHENKHILYCDSGLFHYTQDSLISKWYSGRDYEQEYYDQLERLFTMLESHYQIPVVIATHPHSLYGDKAFHGRKLVYGKTCELAKDATVFVTTTS